jgi:hypothetical protein
MLTDISEVRTASIIRAMLEAVRTSETSITFNVTIRRCVPELNFKLVDGFVDKTSLFQV